MGLSRREMLLASLGLLIGGCTEPPSLSSRPGAAWPQLSAPSGGGVDYRPPASRPSRDSASSPAGSSPLSALARSRWTRQSAVPSRVNPMNGVGRITVHHEGWHPVWFDDYASTKSRLETIRQSHVSHKGWGDIGYHFIIDRAGRVWEGRDLRYQGAHVSQNNEHNIGIMCLGNFDKQSPSPAQLRSLVNSLRTLMNACDVPLSRVYTHQELKPTACPGRHLQPRMVAIRHNGHLV